MIRPAKGGKLKVAALCQFTLSGPPIVYYGTEVGMPGTSEEVAAISDQEWGGARLHMFIEDAWDKDLLVYYRWLIHFRREHPVIWRGERKTVLVDGEKGHYGYTVSDGKETILVVLNLSEDPATLDLAGHSFSLDGWSGDLHLIVG